MPEKRADFVRRLGRENVLELAGLLFDFGFAIHCQAVGKQPLGQPVTANNAAGALAAARGEFDNQSSVANRGTHRFQGVMARVHEWLVIVRLWRMIR